MRRTRAAASLFAVALAAPLHVTVGAPPRVPAGAARSGASHVELVALHDPGGARGDGFGHAVALSASGTVAVVGADDANGGRGAAYVYVASRFGWPKVPTATLFSPAGAGAQFGFAVALSPDGATAYVSADAATIDGVRAAGAVYAFTESKGVWPTSPSATLRDPALAAGDYFGVSLSIAPDGADLVVGAPGTAVDRVADAGAAYVYAIAHGAVPVAPTATLTDPTGGAGLFGYDVAAADDAGGRGALVVGAYATADGSATSAGAADVYDADGAHWSLAPGGALSDPGRASDDDFGGGVAVDAAGTLVLVGAAGETERGVVGAGAVLTYARVAGSWVRKQTLRGPTGALGVGAPSIAAGGATAIVGAPGTRVDGHAAAGLALVYVGPGATLALGATVPDPTGGSAKGEERFGAPSAVSADGDWAIVGAPVATGTGSAPGPGIAYLYDVAPHPTITRLAPHGGPAAGATRVTIGGVGLAGATSVRFGTVAAAAYAVTATGALRAVAPPHAPGQVRVTVTTPGGATPARPAATYTYT